MFVRLAWQRVLMLTCLATAMSAGQEERIAEQPAEALTAWLPLAAYEQRPDDDELTRLLKARFRTAASEVLKSEFLLKSGFNQTVTLKSHRQAQRRAARAAAELCQTPEQRIAILEQSLRGAKAAEVSVEERVKQGRDPASDYYFAQYDRLDAEVELIRAKRAAKQRGEDTAEIGQPVTLFGPINDEMLATWLPLTAFQETPRDDELTRLLKQRYRAAAAEGLVLKAMVEGGIGPGVDTILQSVEAEERTSRAARELVQKPAEQIAILEKLVDRRKTVEKYERKRFLAGATPVHALLRARYQRLEAELELARLLKASCKKYRSTGATGERNDSSGEAEEKALAAWLPTIHFRGEPCDDESVWLLKQRYRAAASEAIARWVVVQSGTGEGLESLRLHREAEGRACTAALELCRTRQQRLDVLEKALQGQRELEAQYEMAFQSGKVPPVTLLLIRHGRLDAELALVRAKSAAAGEVRTPADAMQPSRSCGWLVHRRRLRRGWCWR